MGELTERLKLGAMELEHKFGVNADSTVFGQAVSAIEAQEARIKELEEAAKTAAMYLRTGFIECEICGHEVETKNTDAWFELREVLSKTQTPPHSVKE